MSNDLRNYWVNKPYKMIEEVKHLIMAQCRWDSTKWSNKLQGRSALTELERKEIIEIEKRYRIRAELNWTMQEYINNTQPGAVLTPNQLAVINKYKDFDPINVFGDTQTAPCAIRTGVEM